MGRRQVEVALRDGIDEIAMVGAFQTVPHETDVGGWVEIPHGGQGAGEMVTQSLVGRGNRHDRDRDGCSRGRKSEGADEEVAAMRD